MGLSPLQNALLGSATGLVIFILIIVLIWGQGGDLLTFYLSYSVTEHFLHHQTKAHSKASRKTRANTETARATNEKVSGFKLERCR